MSNNKLNNILGDMIDDRDFQVAMLEEELIHRVGLRILEYRKGHGLSQSELAKRIGSKQPRIAQIEKGESNLTLRALVQLSYALGVDAEEMVMEEPPYVTVQEWDTVFVSHGFVELGDSAPEAYSGVRVVGVGSLESAENENQALAA